MLTGPTDNPLAKISISPTTPKNDDIRLANDRWIETDHFREREHGSMENHNPIIPSFTIVRIKCVLYYPKLFSRIFSWRNLPKKCTQSRKKHEDGNLVHSNVHNLEELTKKNRGKSMLEINMKIVKIGTFSIQDGSSSAKF